MRKRPLTAQELFLYASRYAKEQEAAGNGTQYPTLREASRRYKVSMDTIETLAGEGVEDGYLGIVVGFMNHGGVGSFETRGEQLVEAYT